MLPLFRHPISSFVGCLAAISLLCPSQAVQAADTGEARKYEVMSLKDVTYYDGEDRDKVKHKLDLYLPKDKKEFPVLFFIHGGAWVHGDKSFLGLYSSFGHFYASHGIGVVVTNYRLSPHVQHPEHIKDVARAFAWTVKNIEKYGGRPDQIFVCGHSAGGHLAALLATDETYLKAEGLSFKNIKGVIPISGVYEVPVKMLSQVFGKDEEVRKKASPTFNAKAGLPPFLVLYADKDMQYCDKEPAQAFYKALTEKGCTATICEIKDSGHMLILLAAYAVDSPVSKKVLEFITAQTAK
jgi:acetyl esterase/lipase